MTFEEFYEYGKCLTDKKWNIYAVGGKSWYFYKVDKKVYKLENFRTSEKGEYFFDLNQYDNEKIINTLSLGYLSCLKYRIEVFNENPLQILIEWKSNVEGVKSSELIILEETYDI
jgi:hypothetical protein